MHTPRISSEVISSVKLCLLVKVGQAFRYLILNVVIQFSALHIYITEDFQLKYINILFNTE